MLAVFACPECGAEVGGGPGRTVACSDCGTLVEIPRLPLRTLSRPRRGRPVGLRIAMAGLAVAVAMVAVAAAVAYMKGRSNKEHAVAEAVKRAERAEKDGNPSEGLAEVESALKLARTLDRSARAPLKALRDRLAVRDSEARLAQAESLPDPIEAYRALRAEIDRDPAREPVRDRVNEALAKALGTRSESDLAQAASALATGHPAHAIDLCERVAAAAEELGPSRASGLREAAREVASRIIGQAGVTFPPVTGEFLGANAEHATTHATNLRPTLAATLSRKGYLPRPARSAFLDLWDSESPYRMEVEVIERREGSFFATSMHLVRLNAHISLWKGTTVLWQSRPSGQTREPPPSMGTFEISQLTLDKKHDASVEKRLYDDARLVLAENLVKALGNLPAR